MVAKRKIAFHPDKGYHALDPNTPPKTVRRNARERNRVKQIDEGFDKLKSNIPVAAAHKKLSRVKILQTAVEYIQHLHTVLTDHETVCGVRTARTPSFSGAAGLMSSLAGCGSPQATAASTPVGHISGQAAADLGLAQEMMVKQEPAPGSVSGHDHQQQQNSVCGIGTTVLSPQGQIVPTATSPDLLDQQQQICSPGNNNSVGTVPGLESGRATTPVKMSTMSTGNSWSPPPPSTTANNCQHQSGQLTSTPINSQQQHSYQTLAGNEQHHQLLMSGGPIPPVPPLTAHYPSGVPQHHHHPHQQQQQQMFQQPHPHSHFMSHLTPPSAGGYNHHHHHAAYHHGRPHPQIGVGGVLPPCPNNAYPYSPPISSPMPLQTAGAAPISPFFDSSASSTCSSGYFSSSSPMSTSSSSTGLNSPSPRGGHPTRSMSSAGYFPPPVKAASEPAQPPPLMQDPTPSTTTFHEEDEEILNSIIQWEKY